MHEIKDNIFGRSLAWVAAGIENRGRGKVNLAKFQKFLTSERC